MFVTYNPDGESALRNADYEDVTYKTQWNTKFTFWGWLCGEKAHKKDQSQGSAFFGTRLFHIAL